MDKSAPATVAQGTLVTSVASAFVTGVVGAVRGNPHYGFMAGAAALNSGITAATFFAVREYAISPVLVTFMDGPQYRRRRQLLGIQPPGEVLEGVDETMPLSLLQYHKLLDTAISGAIAGGIIRGWRSGRRAIIPGALVATFGCAAIQLGYNQIGLLRLSYLLRQNQAPTQSTTPAPAPTPNNSPTILQRLGTAIFGLKPVTDEEYLEKLKRTRDHHLKRIQELEAQVAEEKRQKEGNITTDGKS